MTELNVPIRDRRQSKRILTLKNARWALLVFAVAATAVTIQSEMRRNIADDYGRLFGKQVAREDGVVKPKFDVVKEAPVVDQTAADPLLVAPAAREQYLGVADNALQPVANSVMTTAQPLDAPRGGNIAIVGGTDGVSIVKSGSNGRPATLAGGIFRRQ